MTEPRTEEIDEAYGRKGCHSSERKKLPWHFADQKASPLAIKPARKPQKSSSLHIIYGMTLPLPTLKENLWKSNG